MKKIVKQDGKRRVFILEDGTEIPFEKTIVDSNNKKKKKFFSKKEDDKLIEDFDTGQE